jgi:hypothetical protein
MGNSKSKKKPEEKKLEPIKESRFIKQIEKLFTKKLVTQEDKDHIQELVRRMISQNIFNKKYNFLENNTTPQTYLFYILVRLKCIPILIEYVKSEYYDPKTEPLEANTNYTYVTAALSYKEYELAKQLITRGCRFNISDSKRNTPLMLAIKHKYYDLAKLILETDICEPQQQNTYTQTALTISIQNGNTELACDIIDSVDSKMANITKEEYVYFTESGLYMASLLKNEDVVRKLFTTVSYDQEFILKVYKKSIKTIRKIICEFFDLDNTAFLIEKYGIDKIKASNLNLGSNI